MNIATDTAARKPFFQNSCDILNILPVHVKKWRSKTLGLTPAAKGAAFELWCAAFEHEGKLQDDDNFLARIVGTTKAAWLKIKPALRHLFQKVGDLLLFPELIEEISRMFSKREEKVSAANARWQKNTPRMGQNNKARKPKKSNEINEDLMQTHCGCNATSEHIESSLRSDSVESDKSDSRHPQAADQPEDPFDPRQWQAEKMADPEAVPPKQESNGAAPQPEAEQSGNYPKEFNLLWDTLPKRKDGKGCVKKRAYKRWKSLSVAERDRAQAGAVLLKKKFDGKSKEYAPGKTNWIRDDGWDDVLDAANDPDDDDDDLVGEMGSRIVKNAKGEPCLMF